MSSKTKALALAESELRLLENSVGEMKHPWLEGDVERAIEYCKKKNVPGLLASLEEIQPQMAKFKRRQVLAERMTPVIQQLGAVQFTTEILIQKKKILNHFIAVRRILRTIQTITSDKNLRQLVDDYEDKEKVFQHDVFKADTPDKVLEAVHLFSEVSQLVRTIVGVILSKEKGEPEFKRKPEAYELLVNKQVDLLDRWNKLPEIFIKIFEDAHRRIKPNKLFVVGKQQGVETIQA